MVVMETPFASSNAVFYSLLAVGHMLRQPREQKFTGSILQEHFWELAMQMKFSYFVKKNT